VSRLRGKVVLITGASSGIGEACARAFAAEGAGLVLAARREERLRQLSRELETEHGVNCHAAGLDVRDPDAVERFEAGLPSELRAIDILLNNAGLARGLCPVHEGETRDWEEMIDTNLKGLLYLTRRFLPGMIERGRGHIINIGSIAGRQVYPGGGVYCATKFAVRALTQALAVELVDTPIRVSVVDPGMVQTEFSVVRFRGDEEGASGVYRGLTPLTGDDVAEAVLFCATRPPNVNVAELMILPADQASVYHIHRDNN